MRFEVREGFFPGCCAVMGEEGEMVREEVGC